MSNNYFFIDGSCLIHDIQRFKKTHPEFEARRLNFQQFVSYIMKFKARHLVGGYYKRAVVYFSVRDPRISDEILLPDLTVENSSADDLLVVECGKRLPKSAAADLWLKDNPPPVEVEERLTKVEKAVDTQICCDALQLAATGKLDRLMLYTNDFDFVPLCRSLRALGTNISLVRLMPGRLNTDLRRECDSLTICGNVPSLFTPAEDISDRATVEKLQTS